MSKSESGSNNLIKRYRVDDGAHFNLSDFDPADTDAIGSDTKKEKAEQMLRDDVAELSELQEKLYAQNRWALLLIFQAMDAAGKDGTIKHVMSGVNPTGVQVYSFKAPSTQELDHDFMWRTSKCLPERGRIGIFNRSYYEETLIVRVHPELLDRQQLPHKLVTDQIWRDRFEDIKNLEQYLHRNGVLVRKFFLHLSKDEQRRRLLSRLEDPSKNWKYSGTDVKEREHWDEYMHAYEEAVRHTATPHAPWFVVPADHKWYTRLIVVRAIIDALKEIDPAYPKVSAEQGAELEAARRTLEKESKRG